MHNLHVLDILGVSLLLFTAVTVLYRNFSKMRKAKGCATLCNGCSANSCSTKVFKIKHKN
ncbi:MAG: hypothetical protein ORN24_00340 [Burkholderiales bacterium]|nr:hypothetical protein [Burkholderiales bacterium]